ncbi:MAG: type II toxin-antitoxin system VapC family toxin [Micropruina sp.]|uniref:type II toxin-antitoxin system VapC family toxin n=1 Tax=Micropruina sp. TaxID=2737536 RepID=UPI0039E3C29A
MGVSYLLDTHAVLWLLGDPQRMPSRLVDELADPGTQLWVSSASAMEIAAKVRIGRLPVAEPLIATWFGRLGEIDADELPITARHALLAGSLTWHHRDPFDRFLAAQSITDGIPLVTIDPVLQALPGLITHW